MNEASWTLRVTDLAGRLGLLWHWCPDSRRCKGPNGFPDLVIAGTRGVIFAELKTEYGETSADQDLWAWTLHEGKQGWRLWVVPRDWDNGRIERELEAIR